MNLKSVTGRELTHEELREYVATLTTADIYQHIDDNMRTNGKYYIQDYVWIFKKDSLYVYLRGFKQTESNYVYKTLNEKEFIALYNDINYIIASNK